MGNTFLWISFLLGLFFFLFLSSVKRREEGERGGTEERTRHEVRVPTGGVSPEETFVLVFLFFSDGISSDRKSGNLKGRQRNFLIFFLFFFFFSFSFLEKEEEKGTERWMERIGVWNHSGRLFSSKDRFFETPDPLFGWSSGSFTLNKLE
jgi:hypothetical protein